MTAREAREKIKAMMNDGSWDNLPKSQLEKKIADWNYLHGFVDSADFINVEALNNVLQGARFYINRKYGDRKRLSLSETWEKSTLIRDINEIERFILSL